MATANQKAINGACEWAIKIANDNNFHYGRTKWAHKYGCYFCGTQGAKVKAGASKSQAEKTYCCNPFVVASFVHGAGVDKKCGTGGLTVPLAGGSTKSMLKHHFKKVSKPSEVNKLKKGDVLLTKTHAMLYVGDGKICHAKHHDNGVRGSYWNESICHEKIPSSQWKRVTQVWRYYGYGKFKDDVYTVGKTYYLKEDMNVRKSPSATSEVVPESEWTKNALQYRTKDGLLAKGTKVTVKEVAQVGNAIWVKIPTGWICAMGSAGKEFVTEELPTQK